MESEVPEDDEDMSEALLVCLLRATVEGSTSCSSKASRPTVTGPSTSRGALQVNPVTFIVSGLMPIQISVPLGTTRFIALPCRRSKSPIKTAIVR